MFPQDLETRLHKKSMKKFYREAKKHALERIVYAGDNLLLKVTCSELGRDRAGVDRIHVLKAISAYPEP